MPGRKHLRGVGKKEQRPLRTIKARGRRKPGRYGRAQRTWRRDGDEERQKKDIVKANSGDAAHASASCGTRWLARASGEARDACRVHSLSALSVTVCRVIRRSALRMPLALLKNFRSHEGTREEHKENGRGAPRQQCASGDRHDGRVKRPAATGRAVNKKAKTVTSTSEQGHP